MAENSASLAGPTSAPQQPLPRVAIQFCTQCKWMLRAAYFAQELLSTFSTSLGEVALVPATGGIFTVTLTTQATSAEGQDQPAQTQSQTQTHLLWDRKSEGGFPETKELKRRVRDVIQPDRDLGHVDKNYGKAAGTMPAGSGAGGESGRKDTIVLTGTGTGGTESTGVPSTSGPATGQQQPQQAEGHTKASAAPSVPVEEALAASAAATLQKHPQGPHPALGGPPGSVRPVANPPPSMATGSRREQEQGRLSEDVKDRVAAAGTNKGQQGPSGANGEALKAQLGKGSSSGVQAGQGEGQGGGESGACEDCA